MGQPIQRSKLDYVVICRWYACGDNAQICRLNRPCPQVSALGVRVSGNPNYDMRIRMSYWRWRENIKEGEYLYLQSLLIISTGRNRCEWKLDPNYWPDPRVMCKENWIGMGVKPVCFKSGLRSTLTVRTSNIWIERNMLLRTERGQYGVFDFYGQQTYIDPTIRRPGNMCWSKIRENYYKTGNKELLAGWRPNRKSIPCIFDNIRFLKGMAKKLG